MIDPKISRQSRQNLLPTVPNITEIPVENSDPTEQPEIQNRAMLIALCVSLMLHAMLIVWVYGKPLGMIDPSTLLGDTTRLSVYRAADDAIVSPSKPGEESKPWFVGKAKLDAAASADKLRDTSRAMLGNAGGAAGNPVTPGKELKQGSGAIARGSGKEISGNENNGGGEGLGLRKLPEQNPEQLQGDPAARVPAWDATKPLREKINATPPAGLTYVGDATENSTPTSGSNSEKSNNSSGKQGKFTGPGTNNSSDQARKLLASGSGGNVAGSGSGNGTFPGVTGGSSTGGGGNETSGGRPGSDLSGSAPVDAASVALKGVEKMALPEHLDNDFDYVLTTFEPGSMTGNTVQEPRGYFRVDIAARRSLRRIRAMPKDMVYLIDVSGSINQAWVNVIIAGVKDALNALNPDDRFNVVFFNSSPAFFNIDGVVPATESNIAAAQKFLELAKSGGSTDVNRALSRLLVRDVAIERVYNLVFISDGQPTKGVMDTRELINLITRDNDLSASIFCVGVGDIQNHQLLDFMAYRNRGWCVYASQKNGAATVIRDLASVLRYPIMKDIRLSIASNQAQQIFPITLPNIHQGQTLSVYGRYNVTGPFTMQLAGHNGGQTLDITFSKDLAQALQGDQQLAHDWAFSKLHHLYSLMLQSGSTEAVKKEIERLKQVYGLRTVY